MDTIGIHISRKEAWNKVTGAAKYNGDTPVAGILYAKVLTSPYAHALIKKIHIAPAMKAAGVKAVITGDYMPTLSGPILKDRPPIARDRVRYWGEPVALVVASSEAEAMSALQLIKIDYEPLPIVRTIKDAVQPDAVLLHENLGSYSCAVQDVYPIPGTNISTHEKIRKGNMNLGWQQSDVIVASSFSMPSSDHIALETRNAQAQILPNGNVIIDTSSQMPFTIKEDLSQLFSIPEGNIIVRVPLVGGAFGGKSSLNLEILAYLASLAVGGKLVRIANTREEDIGTSPAKISVEAQIKIGATKEGYIQALECTYYVDCGAYTDSGPRMAKAISADCSGPYRIENLWCDAFSVYTNKTYVTAYRGFGHCASTFCMERILDQLSARLKMDPMELRMKNLIQPGDLSPTQTTMTLSNMGNLSQCLEKLKLTMDWKKGSRIVKKNGMVISKGISCFWKTSSSPTNAISGVVLSLHSDGTVQLNFGAVEIGPGMKTTIAQIVAHKLRMNINKVYVTMEVNTQFSPKHWKTVASMTTFMAGNAALKAAEDLKKKLCTIGAAILQCAPEDLDIGNEQVYVTSNPSISIEFKDLAQGYQYANGNAIGGQIVAYGSYTMKHLTPLHQETGEGRSGLSWTVGAQAVELEYDPKNYTYRILRAATVIDAGTVINPKAAKGVLMGGMSMGLGLGTREEFIYDLHNVLENTSLRTYKLIRLGEQPEYSVDFVETPQQDAPLGAKGLGEHGILGIPSAFANALSLAAEADFNKIPISPEDIWKIKTGGHYDTL